MDHTPTGLRPFADHADAESRLVQFSARLELDAGVGNEEGDRGVAEDVCPERAMSGICGISPTSPQCSGELTIVLLRNKVQYGGRIFEEA